MDARGLSLRHLLDEAANRFKGKDDGRTGAPRGACDGVTALAALRRANESQGSEIPLNQNRNNNRRRGRGNNRGGPGGGNQSNRIDSRARGNAPQMLDKYKKLAHEASLNDDRVQTEYYLQFADHYFRVIADSKPQKDDRPARENDRSDDRQDFRNDDREDDRDDDRGDTDVSDDRQDRGNRQRAGRNERRDNDGRDDNRGNDNRNEGRGNEGRGNESRSGEGRPKRVRNQPQPGAEGEAGDQQDDRNPFTRDDTPRDERSDGEHSKDAQPKARKPRRRKDAEDPAGEASPVDHGGGLDPAMLPPAIARTSDEEGAARKPRKLSTRRKPKDDDDDGAREALG
ncbi:hypothetical protein GCM10011411_24280 [Aurantiacibacter arachoides]|nr:hypothetical protein GCM10011411_24280 [Aurantiacibacter arachoides]